ncbi:MAG TPA: cytochrome c3 family protein [Blastocatellia bacterium]|nr:cytochrome c3 family protein [Blastocatellia bacterium]
MRRIKLGLVILFGLISVLFVAAAQRSAAQKKSQRAVPSALRDNNCVSCHASLIEPVGVSAHFYEWRNSLHEKRGVGCEQCHGGDPKAKTLAAAHVGVLAPSFAQSKLHPQNLPATCNACHQGIVSAFVTSKHYQLLQTSNHAPSCTNCHHHMATSVITWPPDTAALCAKCHNTNGVAAPYPRVPTQAGATIAAFSRAEGIIEWARELIRAGQQKKLSFKPEEAQLAQFEKSLQEARKQWHAFNLTESRRSADEVFRQATEVKDRIWKRLPE